MKSSIRETEHRIAQRRGRLSVALDGVTRCVGERMVSPGALVAAGLFGAALHRAHRLHVLQLLALLETANSSLRLLLTLSSRASPPAAT